MHVDKFILGRKPRGQEWENGEREIVKRGKGNSEVSLSHCCGKREHNLLGSFEELCRMCPRIVPLSTRDG